MALKKRARNAQNLAAAERLRRRPRGFTQIIGRAQRAVERNPQGPSLLSQAERQRERPSGFTSALARVRRNAEANRRRLR